MASVDTGMTRRPTAAGAPPRAVPARRAPRSTLGRVWDRLASWCSSHPAGCVAALGVLACAVAWLRLPGVARDTLWAEDGRDFLQGALDDGPFTQLFTPYAGYLQFLPRVIAGLTVQFAPVPLYALSMTFASCVAAGVMASIVFVCARDAVPSAWPRAFLALIVVLAPLVPREVSGNTANLHSLVLWTMFWMLLYQPRTRAASYALGALALVGALTEIQAVFLLPMFLWKWRDTRRLWPRLGCAVGVGVQLTVSLLWPRDAMHGHVGPASMAYGFLINGVVPAWVPQAGIGPAISWGGIPFALAACIPFAIALAICLRRGSSVQRVAALGLVGVALLVYGVSVLENPYPYYDYAGMGPHALQTLWLTRYGVVPSMMLCALFPLAIAAARPAPGTRKPSRLVRHTATALTLALLVSLAVQLPPQHTRRWDGPKWQPQIAAMSEACAARPDTSVVSVGETLGWHVSLTCGRLQ